jgi:hypothetical protein
MLEKERRGFAIYGAIRSSAQGEDALFWLHITAEKAAGCSSRREGFMGAGRENVCLSKHNTDTAHRIAEQVSRRALCSVITLYFLGGSSTLSRGIISSR